jgi:hypothetical protein
MPFVSVGFNPYQQLRICRVEPGNEKSAIPNLELCPGGGEPRIMDDAQQGFFKRAFKSSAVVWVSRENRPQCRSPGPSAPSGLSELFV